MFKLTKCVFLAFAVNAFASFIVIGWTSPAQAQNDSVFVHQDVPAAMLPGSVHAVSVTLKNTGSTTWKSEAHPYKLGSKSPYDNLHFGVNRIPLDPGEAIAPGQEKTFMFTVIAPPSEGTYTFQWQLFEQDVESFGAWTDPVAVHVLSNIGSNDCLAGHFGRDGVVGLDNGDQRFLCANGQWYDCGWGYQVSWDLNASHLQTVGESVCMNREWPHWQSTANMSVFVEQSVPSVMIAGDSYEVLLTFQNVGTTSWSDGSLPFRLGSDGPKDNLTWGLSRVMLAPGESVAPGQQKMFTFQVSAPSTPGIYTFEWEMLQESVAWFGPSSQAVPVVVNASGCNLNALNDNNPCTFDTCGASGVQHTPILGASCDNASVCDGRETCSASGSCETTTAAPALDDQDPCTSDRCDPFLGAVHERIPGCGADSLDPSTQATPIDRTLVQSFSDTNQFLVFSANPVQVGFEAGVESREAGVVIGHVTKADQTPVAGVMISSSDFPEYGTTQTRADGSFDFFVARKGFVTLQFSVANSVPITRRVYVRPNVYTRIDDVWVTSMNAQSALANLSGAGSAQLLSLTAPGGSTNAATLFIPAGTQAALQMADGTASSVSFGTVRYTELPGDARGAQLNTGKMLSLVAGFDISADEIGAESAVSLLFDRPVSLYVPETSGLSVGTAFALSSVHEANKQWHSALTGVVLKVVETAEGRGIDTDAGRGIDTDADGIADSDTSLTLLGMT